MTSKCRQNYHEESEAFVNQQINVELKAYYQYLALVSINRIQKWDPFLIHIIKIIILFFL